jgi:hypothetical protein
MSKEINFPLSLKKNINFNTGEVKKAFDGYVKTNQQQTKNKMKEDSIDRNTKFNNKFETMHNDRQDNRLRNLKTFSEKLKNARSSNVTDETIGDILINTQSVMWDIFKTVKDGKNISLLLTTKKIFYMGVLILVVGVLMLLFSSIF